MIIHLILPTHISFPSSTTTCPHPLTTMTTPPTSPRSLNTRTLCSLHRATLPLLLDISETLSITPTMQSQTPLKSHSDVCLSTLQPSQHPNMPKKVLRFTNPNPLSEGMRTAMEWQKEQLQRARERWNLRNAQRIQERSEE